MSLSPAFIKILAETEEKYGNILRPMQEGNNRRVPIGPFTLDWCLRGGLPTNRLSLICGHKGTYKTTLALKALVGYQARCGDCLEFKDNCQCSAPAEYLSIFIDMEHALDESHAIRLGVDKSKVYILKPPNGEAACEYAERLSRVPEVGMIIKDSLASLVPEEELKKGYLDKISQSHRARLIARMVRALVIHTDQADHPRFAIMLNHLLPNRYGGGDILPGGEEQKYMCSVVLKLWKSKVYTVDAETDEVVQYDDSGRRVRTGKGGRKKLIPDEPEEKPEVIRQEVGFLVEHSKVSSDRLSGEFRLILGEEGGLRFGDADDVDAVLARAGRLKLLEQNGGWLVNGEQFATQKAMKEAFLADRRKLDRFKSVVLRTRV
mgnify:CR=1 FL=1